MQSRYYNPDWCRFINADGIAGSEGELLSHNMFAYCRNNAVNRFDPSGYNDEELEEIENEIEEETEELIESDITNLTMTIVPQVVGAIDGISEEISNQITDEIAEYSSKFALGLDTYLDDFAASFGANTWKSFPEQAANWQKTVLDNLFDPNVQILFNLTDVDVWAGVYRAVGGRGGPTDWELLQIYQNPPIWDTIIWFENGEVIANPFER